MRDTDGITIYQATIGPDRWWNPTAPSYPPAWYGRWLRREATAGAAKVAKKADELRRDIKRRADEAAASAGRAIDSALPDPIAAVAAIVGPPTWGYPVGRALPLLAGAAILAAAGLTAAAYKRRKKRR